jgi:SAM-dependent methyltransferase
LARANPHLSFVAVDRPGEQTQLPTGCADVVACFEVLEHVTDPRRVLVEIRRLLRSGGRAVISTSNYASFYEGHYRLPWVPFMNHRCASTWVRMWGANPAFLSEVNLLTWHWLNRTASALGFVVRTSWRTPSCPPPILNVVYDRDIQDIAPLLPTVLQTWIQRPIPHRLLSLIGLQYKICVELTVQ